PRRQSPPSFFWFGQSTLDTTTRLISRHSKNTGFSPIVSTCRYDPRGLLFWPDVRITGLRQSTIRSSACLKGNRFSNGSKGLDKIISGTSVRWPNTVCVSGYGTGG